VGIVQENTRLGDSSEPGYIHTEFWCTPFFAPARAKYLPKAANLENAQIKDHIACGTSPKEVTALTGVHYSTVMRIKKNIEVFDSPTGPMVGKNGTPCFNDSCYARGVYYRPLAVHLSSVRDSSPLIQGGGIIY